MIVDTLKKLAVPPETTCQQWLSQANDGVSFVVENAKLEETVLYSGVNGAYIHSYLVPLENLTDTAIDELEGATPAVDATCCIQFSSFNGESDVYVEEPLDKERYDALDGGEQLVFCRSFYGVDKKSRIEISQKLVHSLDLYWLEEEGNSYCNLDEDGNIRRVVKVFEVDDLNTDGSDHVVTIESTHLHRYMAASQTALVMRFSFQRLSQTFTGWQDAPKCITVEKDLRYLLCVQSDASEAYGILVVYPNVTKQQLIEENNRQYRNDEKQYCSFIGRDWKTEEVKSMSCDPKETVWWGDKDSPKPFQVTPAFFRSEVLLRFKGDREKFDLQERSISSRAGWYLKSYDVNAANQVHVYLCDLAALPYKEQLYWQSFNEKPKGDISDRAKQTDLLGRWSTAENPLRELKTAVRNIDKKKPDWWKVRGEDLESQLHYPHTTSADEWAEAILALDQFVVEGFLPKPLRKKITDLKKTFAADDRPLQLLGRFLVARQIPEDECVALLEPLREVHALRSKVIGHASGSEKQTKIKSAKTKYGSLNAHFRALVADCLTSFNRIVDELEK